MKALVTGASSGIGREISFRLMELGYDLIVVSRNQKTLDKIYKDCKRSVTTIGLDLGELDNCYQLYEQVKEEKVDILVNNAGFGDCGNFSETSLDKELEMIDLNIRAYHVLMKLFLQDFVKRDYGRILNVASMAGFMPGPYMATYYATKAYIVNLTLAVYEELKRDHSQVKISVFCPGPVKTNFSKRARVHFRVGSLTAKGASEKALAGMFQNQLAIIPGNMKMNYVLIKLFPIKMVLSVNSLIQKRS